MIGMGQNGSTQLMTHATDSRHSFNHWASRFWKDCALHVVGSGVGRSILVNAHVTNSNVEPETPLS